MEFTCLSEGKGFYFPPCHILDVCGFRILLDCPMDLSSLTVFSPVPFDSHVVINHEDFNCSCQNPVELESNENKRQKIEKPLDANSLIRAEPRYMTVKNLLLWDVSFIDVILITSPMGMLGLPFLTRNKDFNAKVYVTEAASRIGQLMMEDLVAMHKEFRQFYGPASGAPEWMKWEELELLPLELKQIVLGADGTKFGGWMSLYSAADVKDCVVKVEKLRYAEEACYNGTLIMKAFSSGLDIGSCNWSIMTPKGNISYVSGSVSMSASAMSFNHKVLQGNDVILYSDFSSCFTTDEVVDDCNSSAPDGNIFSNLSDGVVDLEESFSSVNADEYLEEIEKLDFILSCSMDSVKAGGSVLIPIGRTGIILQLLERFALGLESENIKVPMFLISSVAEDVIAYTNVIPEWLCKQRQEKLYSGQPLFTHVEMLKDGRLYLFPAIHSLKLLQIWQEPCIVFCPHWSLRLGPVVHLLRRWCGDQNSLLVMEEGVDANLALLPFQPMAMKVLQCSFLSGMRPQQTQKLLKILQPRHVLFPEVLKRHVGPLGSSFSFGYYSENEKLHVPMAKDSVLDIAMEVATRLHYTTLKQQDMDISRLKGELVMEQGRYLLSRGNEQIRSETDAKSLLHFGRIDLDVLLLELQKMGMNVRVEEVRDEDGSHKASVLHVLEPSKALIEVREAETVINTADETIASLISKAVCSILDCI